MHSLEQQGVLGLGGLDILRIRMAQVMRENETRLQRRKGQFAALGFR